jgi:hypothetical protein
MQFRQFWSEAGEVQSLACRSAQLVTPENRSLLLPSRVASGCQCNFRVGRDAMAARLLSGA